VSGRTDRTHASSPSWSKQGCVRAKQSAATVNAARLLDLADEVGTIAPGKSADVIAVDVSPLDDVSVLERVAFVMARGDVCRGPT
jgi:cytosine/adenosine deaminase-related metal-dependent hydrolase